MRYLDHRGRPRVVVTGIGLKSPAGLDLETFWDNVLAARPQAATAAEEHFLRSRDWARRQGALSWELRTSTSLARLQHGQGRVAEARSLLQSVYDRFSEGFETADLKAAKAYLNSWQ